MKLKEFFYLLGLKPKAREYGYEVHEQRVAGCKLRYAQWLHPRAYSCEVGENELARLREFLREGDVAIDIGAHAGDTSLPMAIAVGRTGHVMAFEANKFVSHVLVANAELNPHIGKIHAFNLAVTDESRDYEFSYNDPGYMNGGAVERTRSFRRGAAFKQTVRGVRLEEFMQENYPALVDKIRYIKVDTEGSDLYILRSISGLIERLHPYIQVEVMRRTPSDYRLGMYDFLAEHGYAIRCHIGGRNSAHIMQREEILDGDDFDLFCEPPAGAAEAKRRRA